MQFFFLQGEEWWKRAGRGKNRVVSYIGVTPEIAELIYQKYLARRTPAFGRLALWLLLAWLRQYPHDRRLELLLPRGYFMGCHRIAKIIHAILRVLSARMVEVTPVHAVHPNNGVHHFPNCLGSVDTYPVKVYDGPRRYAPKYKAPVMKFQVATTHLGFVMYLSGPHVGADSDTKIFRDCTPPLPGQSYLLGDKAYISLPKCLPPIKQNNSRFPRLHRKEFNRIHGHYRSRVEQCIGWMKRWGVLGGRWRSHDMESLAHCAHLIACIRNLHCTIRIPYIPYLP